MSLQLGVSQGEEYVRARASRRRLQAGRGGTWRGTTGERLGGLEGEACHIKERMLLQIRLVPIVIRIKSTHSRKKFSSNTVPCRVIHSRKKFRSNIVPCSYFHLQTLWNVWYVLINFFAWGKSASVKGSITSVCILLPEEGLPGPESFPSVSGHQAPYSKPGENTQHIPSLP